MFPQGALFFLIKNFVQHIYTKIAKGFNSFMNNFKNLLILTLTALLGLSLFIVVLQIKHTHPVAPALSPIPTKTYDLEQLLNYKKCVDDKYDNKYYFFYLGLDNELNEALRGEKLKSTAYCQELLH